MEVKKIEIKIISAKKVIAIIEERKIRIKFPSGESYIVVLAEERYRGERQIILNPDKIFSENHPDNEINEIEFHAIEKILTEKKDELVDLWKQWKNDDGKNIIGGSLKSNDSPLFFIKIFS